MNFNPKNILSALTHTEDDLTRQQMKIGMRWLNIHGVTVQSMIALQGGGPFLASFVLALGASNYEIGLITSIAFIGEFMQVPGLFLLKTVMKRRAIAVITGLIYRLLWALIIFTPFLFAKRGVTFVITCLIASALVSGLMTPAWNSLIREIIPRKIMGRFFSRRLMYSSAAAIALTLAGGYFIDTWEKYSPDTTRYAYSVLFSIGLAAGIVSVYAISRLPERTMIVEKSTTMMELLLSPVQDENFRRLLSFTGAWTFAVNLASPFFIVYMLKRLELSLTMVTTLTITSQVINLIFLRIWGRMVDRFSNKSVLAVSGPLFILSFLGWIFTTMPEKHGYTLIILFGIYIINGISMAGVSAATATIAMKLAPEGLAHGYLTTYGLVGAATGAIAPLVGGVFSDFFASRELALTISWSEPMRQVSWHALNLRALDFLFLFAFLIGIISINLIARVREQGEVTEKEVITHLLAEVSGPLRLVSSIPGIRHLIDLPFAAWNWKNDRDSNDSSTRPPVE